jgi:hypothetical protein
MVAHHSLPIRFDPCGDVCLRIHLTEGLKMAIEKEVADFLHKIISALHIGERDKEDLHTELSVNTKTPPEEEKPDASE